ncbi:hypothetical protein SALBM135S_02426 [Streptomyces alboniger]
MSHAYAPGHPPQETRQLPPTAAPGKPGRDRYLDLLRSLALVRVVIYHLFGWAWLTVVFPSMGVMFALAGSLMARSLKRPALGVIKGRVRRLLPPMWVFSAAVLFLLFAGGWSVGDDPDHGGTWGLVSMANYVFPVGAFPWHLGDKAGGRSYLGPDGWDLNNIPLEAAWSAGDLPVRRVAGTAGQWRSLAGRGASAELAPHHVHAVDWPRSADPASERREGGSRAGGRSGARRRGFSTTARRPWNGPRERECIGFSVHPAPWGDEARSRPSTRTWRLPLQAAVLIGMAHADRSRTSGGHTPLDADNFPLHFRERRVRRSATCHPSRGRACGVPARIPAP